MKEPWETLLGQYRQHWMLADHLGGDAPHVRAIKDDQRWVCLSDGERAMILAAEAMLRLNECYLAVDDANRVRLYHALKMAVDA